MAQQVNLNMETLLDRFRGRLGMIEVDLIVVQSQLDAAGLIIADRDKQIAELKKQIEGVKKKPAKKGKR